MSESKKGLPLRELYLLTSVALLVFALLCLMAERLGDSLDTPELLLTNFQRGQIAYEMDIYRLDAYRRIMVNLTRSTNTIESYVQSDGASIFYISQDLGMPTSQIIQMNADGTHKRPITDTTEVESNLHLSPDGAHLAYTYIPIGSEFSNAAPPLSLYSVKDQTFQSVDLGLRSMNLYWAANNLLYIHGTDENAVSLNYYYDLESHTLTPTTDSPPVPGLERRKLEELVGAGMEIGFSLSDSKTQTLAVQMIQSPSNQNLPLLAITDRDEHIWYVLPQSLAHAWIEPAR